MDGIKEIMTHIIDEDYFHKGDAVHVELFDDNGDPKAFNGLIIKVYDDNIEVIAVSDDINIWNEWNETIYACDIASGIAKVSKLS